MKVSEIITSIPINKTAGMVTQKGIHFDPEIKIIDRLHTDIMPETRDPLPNSTDIIGVKNGSFTVVGLYRHCNNRWVVRCDCGRYELRTAKAMRNPKNDQDACIYCRKWRDIKKSYNKYKYFETFGEWPDDGARI